MKNTNLIELITAGIILILSGALFTFILLYLTTYDCKEMTQIEWLNWLFTGKGA